MAKQQSNQPSPHMDMEAHRQTYAGFVTASIAGTIACLYILVALAAVAFSPWGTLICWATLVAGGILLVLDAKGGSGKWTLSGGGLVVFSLITLLNV